MSAHLMDLSDADIVAVANPIIDDLVAGSNARDWDLFAKHQTPEERDDPANRANVESQWQTHRMLITLDTDRRILAVLRRDDRVQLVWVQHSTAVPGDFLARLYLQEIDGEVREIGFLIQ